MVEPIEALSNKPGKASSLWKRRTCPRRLAMIELVGVGKAYGRRWAVQDLTFSARPGEVLGLLGPNGAGKTTTMRIVTGYLPPTTGSVRVAGVDALEDPVKLKSRVGYLPEIPPIYGEMTVRGYLGFVAEMRRVSRHRRRRHVDEVMERVGLTEVAHRVAGRLSRGYKQRLGLGAALVGYPPVLVLDEPTSGLDPQQILEVRRLIRSLAGQHTVLLSSHVLPEVASTCERVLIINRGRLVAQDTPENLARRVRGGCQLQLEVRGPREAVEAALAEVPGVRSARFAPREATAGSRPGEPRPEAEAGSRQPGADYWKVWVDLELAGGEANGGAPRGQDPREVLFFACARRGLPLLEMRTLDASLEEVFLQLVTEEPAAEPRDVPV